MIDSCNFCLTNNNSNTHVKRLGVSNSIDLNYDIFNDDEEEEEETESVGVKASK